jgi:hypothetical protein
VNSLQEHILNLTAECQRFCMEAQSIAARRALNRLTLQYHTQILEVRIFCCFAFVSLILV